MLVLAALGAVALFFLFSLAGGGGGGASDHGIEPDSGDYGGDSGGGGD
ncbi:MAG: hypothetical protein AMXMBFR33_02790 [Candidatus Xenobia bacterium]